jgi:hypothetical protein
MDETPQVRSTEAEPTDSLTWLRDEEAKSMVADQPPVVALGTHGYRTY